MIYKKEIIISVKILFIFLQFLLMFLGIASLIIVLPLYIRINSITTIMFKHIFPILFESFLCMFTSCVGFLYIVKKHKYLYCVFVFSLIILLNLQLFMILNNFEIIEKIKPWINNSWTSFSDFQRDYIQKQFKCCGLETLNNINSDKCEYTNVCMDTFLNIIKNLQYFLNKFTLALFIIETIGLLILALVK